MREKRKENPPVLKENCGGGWAVSRPDHPRGPGLRRPPDSRDLLAHGQRAEQGVVVLMPPAPAEGHRARPSPDAGRPAHRLLRPTAASPHDAV